LALHELCTNAAKYGALSVPDGRVDITWTVTGPAGKARLWWQWAESGGPVVKAPVRKGFGSSLIEQVLPMELLGEVKVTCSIPDVCIDERRLPLFIARATLRDLIAGLEARATDGVAR